MNLSRRKLLGGSAALAVAAVAGAGKGQTFMLQPGGANTGPPMLREIEGFDIFAADLRPGAINYARKYAGFDFIPQTYDDKIRMGYQVADGGDGVLVWMPPRGSI